LDYFFVVSIAAEKIAAEVMALPEQDRACLARQLIASLDDTVDADAEAQWNEVIDRRSREMAEGRVDARPEAEVMGDIRAKLHARHPTS
jgi:putative addiction module component (TIGR02574 family)